MGRMRLVSGAANVEAALHLALVSSPGSASARTGIQVASGLAL